MPRAPSTIPAPRRPAPRYAPVAGTVSARRLNDMRTLSTMVIMAGLVAGAVASMHATTPLEAFSYPGPFVGVALAIAFIVEGRAGLRNLVRVDLFMLAVLYLLTFFEFLLPQDNLNILVTFEGAQTGVWATLVGFAGLALGRHAFPATRPLPREIRFEVSPRATMILLLGCTFLGYLYMLRAVNFDIAEMFFQMGRPRFSQPWSRGRLGGISTLLNEFGLLKYLLPPLVASILAQHRRYSALQKIVALMILGLVFYEAFAGGTRNVFLTHLITFTVTVALLMPRLTLPRLAMLAVPLLAVSWFAIYYLPEIRTVGLRNFDIETARTDSLFVDRNLVNISILVRAFPDYVEFLGFEIPFTAAVRPIPRALWSGKPEGLSISIEEVIGVRGMTLSATFIGELWMAGGYVGVALGGLCFGAAAARWNRVGAEADTNMRLILFAAGFFPAGICMRSFLSVAPAILPIFALLLFMRFFRERRRRARAGPAMRPS